MVAFELWSTLRYYPNCHLYQAIVFAPHHNLPFPHTNNNNNTVNSFPQLEWAVGKTTNVNISNKRLSSCRLEAGRLFYPFQFCYRHFSLFYVTVLLCCGGCKTKSDLVWMCSLSDWMIVTFYRDSTPFLPCYRVISSETFEEVPWTVKAYSFWKDKNIDTSTPCVYWRLIPYSRILFGNADNDSAGQETRRLWWKW